MRAARRTVRLGCTGYREAAAPLAKRELMTAIDTRPTRGHGDEPTGRRPLRFGSIELLVALLIVAVVARGWLAGLVTSARAGALTSVFLAVVLQALPFLVAGTLATAAARAFVRPLLLRRWLVRRGPAVAVPVAVVAAIVPPGEDEHPALIRAGVPAAAVFGYQLAAPAISPVVLVATAVALPGHPMLVLARAVAGLLVAIGVGWLWPRIGHVDGVELPAPDAPADFWAYARVTLVRAAGVLVAGALLTALLTVAAPAAWSQVIAGRAIFSVIALALLAVLVCIPAEAGPAVAVMLSSFSLTARLVFLVAGPAVNLRRLSQQSIVYGPAVALRLAASTLGASLAAVALVAWML
jgi:uncharacterized protein